MEAPAASADEAASQNGRRASAAPSPQVSGTAVVTLDSGLTTLRSAAVSPSGLLAVTYGVEVLMGRLTVWDVAVQTERRRIETGHAPASARFTPDETAVVGALVSPDDRSAEVVRWQVDGSGNSGEVIHAAREVAGVAMSRDSQTVVLRGRVSGLTVLNTVTGNATTLAESSSFDRVAVSPLGGLIAASAGGRIEVYERTRAPGIPLRLANAVDFGAFKSMDCSETLLVAASGPSVSIVHGGARREVYSAPGPVQRIAITGSGSVLAVAYDSGIDVVDLTSGRVLLQWPTESPAVRLTFRLDDRFLVTAHGDNTARLWELPELPAGRDQVDWLSDAPARIDLLQRKPLARALATRLRRFQDEKEPSSFLIHIDGPWGAGKSTLLYLLRQELEQGDPQQPQPAQPTQWLGIDFNAWRQSKVGAPWWALLVALRHDVGRGRKLPVRVWLRITEAWARFRRGGAPFLLAFLVLLLIAVGFFLLLRPHKLAFASSASIAQGTTAVLVALGTVWAGARVAGRFFLWDSARGARLYEQSSVNPMQDVAQHFGWLIEKAKRPVVFFIDDLDRCADTYVVDLLETVQTLIRDPADQAGRSRKAKPPSFVIAADGAWVRQSFETAYGQFTSSIGEPGLPLGYLFLDKLFQLRVPVPRVDAVRQDSYLRHLLRGVPEPDQAGAGEEEVRGKLLRSSTEADVMAALRQASPQVRDRVAEAAVAKLSSRAVVAETEHRLQQFAALLPPNPRAMKRFVNDYSILRAVRTLEGNTVRMEPLALWAIIETRWPGLADYLRTHPAAIGLVADPETQGITAEALAGAPAELRSLFADLELRKLTFFPLGGPLTPDVIAQCAG